jgi:hypothetical protein
MPNAYTTQRLLSMVVRGGYSYMLPGLFLIRLFGGCFRRSAERCVRWQNVWGSAWRLGSRLAGLEPSVEGPL